MAYFIYEKENSQVITDDPLLYVKIYGAIGLVAILLWLLFDSLGMYEKLHGTKPEVIFTATPYSRCKIYDEMSSNPNVVGTTNTKLLVYKAIDNWLVIKDEDNKVGWVNCRVKKHLPK